MSDIARLFPALAAMLLTALFSTSAQAVGPPDMPLPECIYVAGKPVGGACPALNDYVSGNASGKFTAGGSVVITTVPAVVVCDGWGKYTGIWEPSSCYAEVAAPTIVACAAIDLRNDNRFREMPCAQALYKTNANVADPLFTMRRPDGATDPWVGARCGAEPAYDTYYYGGDGGDPTAVWRSRGPAALKCEVTNAGRRPDGLYGPTWVKVRVGINRAETPQPANGARQFAEFYVPIDGDLRSTADVEVTATASPSEVNWEAGRLFATYKATLRNIGEEDADNVDMTVRFPSLTIIQSVTGADCTKPTGDNASESTALPLGGSVNCKWTSIAGHGSGEVEIVARITNATDLAAIQRGESLQNFGSDPHGVLFKAKADNDVDSRNNEWIAKVDIPFRSGSYAETRSLMEAFAFYFDYTTDKYFKTCNVYKADILERLQRIDADHPGAFASLSYGPITSGQYLIAGLDTSLTRAGHVGVVVYAKGTDYRKTGIIINGTPSPSPLAPKSEIGPNDPGGIFGHGGWTGANGLYLRTPANEFPGTPQAEGNAAFGFEGEYPGNGSEFTVGGAASAPPAPSAPMTCPLAPEAVTVTTQSPVEIIATNSSGHRVETKDGMIVAQDLGTGIHSMAFPHEDGTFGWTLVLPIDDYDVKLVGTRTGPYKLILTTFAPDGTPIDKVTEGFTNPGQTDEYVLEAPEAATPVPPVQQTPSTSNGGNAVRSGRGGGGGVGVWLLLSLLLLWQMRAHARRRSVRIGRG